MKMMVGNKFSVREQVVLLNTKKWFYNRTGINGAQCEHVAMLGLLFTSSKTETAITHCHPSMIEGKDLNKTNVFTIQHRLNKKLWEVCNICLFLLFPDASGFCILLCLFGCWVFF